MLIKVKADADSRAEIMQIVEIFRAKIVDVGKDELIVEMTGTREKVERDHRACSRPSGSWSWCGRGGSRWGGGRPDLAGKRTAIVTEWQSCTIGQWSGGDGRTMLYDKDADLGLLKGKTVAVIGFGSQGHAHCPEPAGQRRQGGGGRGPRHRRRWERAVDAGFEVVTADAAAAGPIVVMMLVPDQTQKVVYESGHPRQPQRRRHADVRPRLQHPLQPDRPAQGRRRDHGRAQGPRAPGAPGLHRGRRRARPGGRLSGRHRQGPASRWPTPRASAHCGPASSRPPSRRRPRPTCSASRPCCAAGAASSCAPASRPWSRPAISRRSPTSSACTSSS